MTNISAGVEAPGPPQPGAVGAASPARRTWILSLAAVAATALLVTTVALYVTRRPAVSTFRTLPVRRADITKRVTATGTLQPNVTVARDPRRMQVHAAVDGADIGEVRPGQRASVSVDALRDRTFKALVKEVRSAPRSPSNGVTPDVVLDVENPDPTLRPGMTASVLILVAEERRVVAVPNEALRFRPTAPTGWSDGEGPSGAAVGGAARGGAAVYVVAANGAVRVPIRVGITDGTFTAAEGIEPGREVIVDVVLSRGGAPAAGATRGD